MQENMIFNNDKYQFRKETLEDILMIIDKQNKIDHGKVLFFGDSLVSNMPEEWNVINNGLGGMSSCALENLLDELVIKFEPSDVYLHIGTNDLGKRVMSSPRTIAMNVKDIFYALIRNLPDTKFHLISTLPCVDEVLGDFDLSSGIRSNAMHTILNQEYQDHLKDMDVEFIDLYQYLINEDGTVKEEYYIDGLHINEKGYFHLLEKFKENLEL